MSELNGTPASIIPSLPVAPGEGIQQAAGSWAVSARRPVRTRSTWILSMALGVGG